MTSTSRQVVLAGTREGMPDSKAEVGAAQEGARRLVATEAGRTALVERSLRILGKAELAVLLVAGASNPVAGVARAWAKEALPVSR